MSQTRWIGWGAMFLLGGLSGWMARGGLVLPEAGGRGEAGKVLGGAGAELAGRETVEKARPRSKSVVPLLEEGEVSRAGRERFLAETRREMESRLAEWADSLGLAEDQIRQLQVVIDETMGLAAEAAKEGTFHGPWVEGMAMAEALERVMDASQREKWDAWRMRRQQARAEADAAANLAEIEQAILLDPGQRELLQQALLTKEADRPAATNPHASIAVAPDVMAEIQRRLGAGIEDPAAFEATAREVVAAKVESDLAAVRDALRPAQLEAYRKLLARKHGGWLDPQP